MSKVLKIAFLSTYTLIANCKYYNDLLINAAERGDLNATIQALSNGADIEAKDHSQKATALAWASYRGRVNIVEYLLKNGANVNSIEANGMTPLHNAATKGHAQVADMLLKAGAKKDIPDYYGMLASDYAIMKNDIQMLSVFDGHNKISAPVCVKDESVDERIDFDDIKDLRRRLEKLNLPKNVHKKIKDKLDLYERLPLGGHESGDIKKYLQHVFGLPWGKSTKDNLDINKASAILDEDHFGLKEIKDRILDFVAVRQLKANGNSPIICFVGPPGIGKTSLVKSIARCLDRKYFKISLGGLRDVAELKGHSSTYIGSNPGQIMQGFTSVQADNPVILLDEIDKVSDGNHYGNPSATMLEVLDPNQNNNFHDDYFGFTFDISKAMFVATANNVESIPAPLRDRMEIIYLNGYTVSEKVAIAKNYLVKKAKMETGLENQQLNFSDDLLKHLATNYSFESGVRELERVIKKLCSKAARSLIEEKKLIEFNINNVEKYLGKPQKVDREEFKNQVGVSNGLAWTSIGGEVLKVEAILMPGGTGKLMLTGLLGKVMKESVRTALSYLRAYCANFKIDPKIFNTHDLHIHLPAAGIPKDGPSAGIAVISAILSALTGKPIDSTYAMTGEVNLRGNVTAIGGLKEKVIAAKRNKIAHVIAPKQNMHDLDESPEVLQDIDIIWVDTVDQVFERVLLKK